MSRSATVSTRLARATTAVGVGALAVLGLWPSAVGGQEPVEYEVLVSKAQGSVSRAVGELPRAPAVADSPGELARLWETFGFAARDSGGALDPDPPHAPPEVDFDRQVAVLLTQGSELASVQRLPGELVLDFTRPEPDDVPTAGLARVRGWVVAVAREDLPSSPFGLVQVLDGLTRYQVKVTIDDGELPRTGAGPWPSALITAVVLIGGGGLALLWTRRRAAAWG